MSTNKFEKLFVDLDEDEEVADTGSAPVSSCCSNVGTTKLIAGLLGIFLGGLGIHKFYLGNKKPALIMLIASLVCGIIPGLQFVSGIMGIIGLIEGIIYLVKSNEDFEEIYVRGKKEWF